MPKTLALERLFRLNNGNKLRYLAKLKSMVKNLVFDFGKVLVDYNYDTFFGKYIADAERRYAVINILCNDDMQHQIDRGERTFEAIMDDAISNNKEFEPEIRIFKDHYPEIVTNEVSGMQNLLVSLKAEGFKLYGLSNWCSKIYVTMAQFGIFSLLDGYIISSDEKVIKPEVEIYHRLFKKYNLKPCECIFADDRAENIEAGRSLGMNGIVFTDAQQFERELRQMIKQQNQ